MEGRFNAGFFALPVWGAYINLEGLIHGGAYFQNFMVASISLLFFVGEDHFFFSGGHVHTGLQVIVFLNRHK